MMRLRIVVPTETVVDGTARKVTAEGVTGWFCLLPRHVDLVAPLVPSVMPLALMERRSTRSRRRRR